MATAIPKSGARIRLDRIAPNKPIFNLGNFEAVRRNQVRNFLEETQERLEEPTATWNHEVEFIIRQTKTGGEVYTFDAAYKNLNRGTKKRYATMSRDFRAKTRPRNFKAGRGSGRLLYVSRRRPRPGIAARDWTGTLAREYNDEGILISKVWQPLRDYILRRR